VPEGGVDDGIRRGRSAAQAFQVFKVTWMRLSPGGLKQLYARIRPRYPKDLAACPDEFFHDGGTDESGSAGNEYTHMCLPGLLQPALTKGCCLG
jgi:hypothetical protein